MKANRALLIGVLLIGTGLASMGGNCDARVDFTNSGFTVDFDHHHNDFEDFLNNLDDFFD